MNRRKLGAAFAAIVTAIGVSSVVIAPAHAAGTPPQDAHLVLLSPVLDATNTSEAKKNQAMADGWVANGWFGDGLLYQRTFAPVGSNINLTYHVTDKDGKPLINQDVKLRINKGYSTSTSILQVDYAKTKGVDKPPLDQADVVHKTDAFGNVTFAVQDLDGAPFGEPQPDSFTSAPNISDDGLNDLHSQMLPEVAGEKPDHSAITEFHYYIPKNADTYSLAHPTIKLVSPALDATNSVSGDGLRQVYAPTGSKFVVVYKVTDDAGVAVRNTVVKLHLNKAGTNSNASITDGKTGTDAKKGDVVLQAMTDAFGFAAFNLQNTDKKGEDTPAAITIPSPTAGAVFSQVVPEVAGIGVDHADVTQFHFYGNATSATSTSTPITVSASSAKSGSKAKPVYTLTLGIANATGKKATISITGLKPVKANISIANQGFAYSVTPGTKKITVVIDGKTYTTSVSVK